MITIATILLVTCCSLCVAAVISFSWSFAAAKLLLLFANIAAAVGALEIAMTIPLNGLATWAILFASGAFSCGAIALRNLKDHPTRWVHRFVIYAGYAATFAAMSISALWCSMRVIHPAWSPRQRLLASMRRARALFSRPRRLIVRAIIKRMPEYAASLSAGPEHYV